MPRQCSLTRRFQLPGVASIHELHVWQLDQQKTIASVHIINEDTSMEAYLTNVRQVGECLHAYGIHSFTVQPELAKGSHSNSIEAISEELGRSTGLESPSAATEGLTCRIPCQDGGCEQPQCCD